MKAGRRQTLGEGEEEMFHDDTQALRALPVEVVAHGLGLESDALAQRQKGGAGYSYWRDPSGELLVIQEQGRRGTPVWWPQSDLSAAGDWLALVQRLRPSLNIGQAKRELRRLAGFANSSSPLPTLAFGQRHRNQSASIRDASAIRIGPLKLIAEPPWAESWLRAKRGLSPHAIAAARAAGMAGVHGGQRMDGALHLNLAFPHADAKAHLCGLEVRGADGIFKGAAGRKAAFVLAPADGACSRILYVTESAIDALALYDYLSLCGRAAWIISTAGRFSDFQSGQIAELAGDLGIATMIGAQDGDEGGDSQAAATRTLAKRVGIGYARILPPGGLKDWGDWAMRRAGC